MLQDIDGATTIVGDADLRTYLESLAMQKLLEKYGGGSQDS
jgi:hypothetical protein